MAKKKRADHQRAPRRPTIQRRDVPAQAEIDPATEVLLQLLKGALYESPIRFLDVVSGILEVTEPKPLAEPTKTLDELVTSFEAVDVAATTAALHVIAVLTGDEDVRERIDRIVAGRRQSIPRWITDLASTTVSQVIELRHVQRDGEDYFLDVQLPDRYAMTALVYVDNNMSGIVKDAYTIDSSWEKFREVLGDDLLGDVPADSTVAEFDPAEARAIIENGLQLGSIMLHAPESDTWPIVRPLVRWLATLLPAGYELPEFEDRTDEQVAEFVDGFLGSPWGTGFDDDVHRGLLDSLHWWLHGTATGDPLRWSPVTVEILLLDIAPRKFDADPDDLDRLPALVKAVVRYAHHERGIGRHLTVETLEAVDRWTPDFRALVLEEAEREPGDRAAELARMLLDEKIRDDQG